MLEFEGRSYEFVRCSDADGMALECWQLGAQEDPVLRAHWRDSDSRFTFTAYEPDLPFELVRAFVDAAREGLPPRHAADSEGAPT